jgi:hypothetical protein
MEEIYVKMIGIENKGAKLNGMKWKTIDESFEQTEGECSEAIFMFWQTPEYQIYKPV